MFLSENNASNCGDDDDEVSNVFIISHYGEIQSTEEQASCRSTMKIHISQSVV